jgi:hypothetical protein
LLRSDPFDNEDEAQFVEAEDDEPTIDPELVRNMMAREKNKQKGKRSQKNIRATRI